VATGAGRGAGACAKAGDASAPVESASEKARERKGELMARLDLLTKGNPPYRASKPAMAGADSRAAH
jgi:hypothetical protein